MWLRPKMSCRYVSRFLRSVKGLHLAENARFAAARACLTTETLAKVVAWCRGTAPATPGHGALHANQDLWRHFVAERTKSVRNVSALDDHQRTQTRRRDREL